MSYQELPTDEQVAYTDDLWGVDDFLAACEVKEASPADWLRATVGLHMDVKHVRGELVKQPSGASTEGWALV